MNNFQKLKIKISASVRHKFSKYKYNRNQINIIYWRGKNFGDALSPDIVKFLLGKKGLNLQSKTKKHYVFLSCVGSVLRKLPFVKKTIWGTGSFEDDIYNEYNKKYSSLDVRCIRGPLTEEKLIKQGVLKNKINIYGDPGILAPLVYPCTKEKKYEVSYIPHMLEKTNANIHIIDPKTTEWKKVVDQIVESKLIISSSLHGIILAEAYGVPAIWLNNEKSSQKPFKYLDYYYSTGRMNPLCVSSIQEGLKIKNVIIPDLSNIQDNLINSFPYDLWR